MSIATNVGGVWKEGTPSKVNVGGVWKSVAVAKVNVGGVWKDVYPTAAPEVEPSFLTEVRYKPTGNPYEMELTAWGGKSDSPTGYMWKVLPGDTTHTTAGKVWIRTFRSDGDFDVSVSDVVNFEFVENRVTVPKYTPPSVTILTDVTYVKTGTTREVTFTAVGGSGTYFWDFDGDGVSNESAMYGTSTITYQYKTSGTKTMTCTDMGNDPANAPLQQGVKVSITLTP